MKKSLKILTLVTVMAVVLTSLCSCFSLFDLSTSEDDGSENQNNSTNSSKKEATISETVCFEYNGLKITATELQDGSGLFSSPGLKVNIVNNSSTDYGIGIEELIINDCMVTSLFSQTVSAGKKANDTITFSSTDLENAKIDTIGKIEIVFYLYHPSEYTRIYTAPSVTINTSAADSVKNEVSSLGKPVYSQGGIVIKCLETKDAGLSGGEALFYIENNSNRNVTVSIEELSVNGYMQSELFVATVNAGKYATQTLDIYASTITDNNISEIENIAFKFHVYDADSYSTIFDTPELTINFK